MVLTKIVTELRELFCGHIGTEYYHLRNRDAAQWIRDALTKYKVRCSTFLDHQGHGY